MDNQTLRDHLNFATFIGVGAGLGGALAVSLAAALADSRETQQISPEPTITVADLNPAVEGFSDACKSMTVVRAKEGYILTVPRSGGFIRDGFISCDFQPSLDKV
ncbi:MAG: hypothetical protein H6855_02145 [Rhodospirillales bacterium]|nr:hypothetical protein [Rhodospirillales bacterium]MCB9980566.1 hypothetical protein [Rhodospirillales bacterium]